jgi:hypothetical protein
MEIFGSKWCVAVESVSPIVYTYSSASELPVAMYLESDTFTQANSSNKRHLCALGRTNRTNELAVYGQRYSIKPCARDVIGVEASTPLENLQYIHLRLVDNTGATIPSAKAEDYMVCLCIYRASA